MTQIWIHVDNLLANISYTSMYNTLHNLVSYTFGDIM